MFIFRDESTTQKGNNVVVVFLGLAMEVGWKTKKCRAGAVMSGHWA